MSLHIRKAVSDDAASFTACILAAYAPYVDIDLPPVAEGIADDIRDHNVWVAEIAGRVQGGIVLVLGAHAHVANLAVHPDAGGHGAGRALIDTAVQAAAAADYCEIQLATHVAMTQTQAFYRKLGWSETGRAANKVYFALKLK